MRSPSQPKIALGNRPRRHDPTVGPMVFALAVGLITPPVGTTMMLSAYIAGVTILDIARESIPYLLYMIVLLYVLIFFQDLVLWVPNTLFH